MPVLMAASLCGRIQMTLNAVQRAQEVAVASARPSLNHPGKLARVYQTSTAMASARCLMSRRMQTLRQGIRCIAPSQTLVALRMAGLLLAEQAPLRHSGLVAWH